MSEPLNTKFYNVRVGRDNGQVSKELRALLDSGPHIVGLCETTGYDLPGVDGYGLVRDRSNKSRANVAAYVAVDLMNNAQWHDCKETWSRTEKPGTHEARSWIEVRVGEVQFLIGHQPPKGTDNTHDAQVEGIDLCVRRMAPWKRDDWDEKSEDEKKQAKDCPRIALCDWNRWPGEEGPGGDSLADRIDGWTAMEKIDGAVFRGNHVTVQSIDYKSEVAGVKLKSDHEWGAFVGKFDVWDKWL